MEPGCERKRKLAEEFTLAARLYAEAAVRLAVSGISPREYERLSKAVKDAQNRSIAAFGALDEHVASHRCDGRPAPEQDGNLPSGRIRVFPKSWAATGNQARFPKASDAAENPQARHTDTFRQGG